MDWTNLILDALLTVTLTMAMLYIYHLMVKPPPLKLGKPVVFPSVLVQVALPLVREYDPMPQSGEWKFHQIYALMRKDDRSMHTDGWRVGLAIHQALAQIRREQEGE